MQCVIAELAEDRVFIRASGNSVITKGARSRVG